MSFSKKNKDLGARFVEIDEDSAGQRLDNLLLRELKGIPRSYVYRIVRSGEVRVNKGRKKPDYRLQPGDLVRIPPVKGTREAATVDAGGLGWLTERILHEDDSLLVLDKPSGMAVHGGSGLSFGVIEALRQLRPELKFLELVHRLDRETSGVLLLAKRRSALRAMHSALRSGEVTKHYTALLQGVMQDKTRDVNVALEKTQRGGERIVGIDEEGEDGKAARSYITRQKTFRPGEILREGATLVDIRLFTGRTHQARVHSAYIGHPIAGDTRYGDDDFNTRIKSLGLKRLFLHAAWLYFPHPDSTKKIRIDSPLPADLAHVLEQLTHEQEL